MAIKSRYYKYNKSMKPQKLCRSNNPSEMSAIPAATRKKARHDISELGRILFQN